MKKFFVLFALFALLAINAFADIRLPDAPKKSKTVDSQMTIKMSPNDKEARLIISKNQLKELRAQLDAIDNENPTAATFSSMNFTRMQTIVSGLFLSLALVFGGVWIARSKKFGAKTGKVIAASAILFLASAFAAAVFANVGPPPEARSITSKLFNQQLFTPYRFAGGKIKLEITNEDRPIELIVPLVPDEPKTTREE